MTPELLAKIIQYMALVPGAISVVEGTVSAVKELLKGDSAPTDAQIEELVNRIMAQHNALPVPE